MQSFVPFVYSAVYSSFTCTIGIWGAENFDLIIGSFSSIRTAFMRNANGRGEVFLLNSKVDTTSNETHLYLPCKIW